MYCKTNLPLTPSERGNKFVEKIKIVYQSGKCPLYNSLRIINYLIPPLEGVGGGFWKSVSYRTCET